MRGPLLVLAVALVVAGCGQREPGFVCPRVAAVAGLDRLDYTYAGTTRPVRAALDVVDATCTLDGPNAFLVQSVVAIRLDPTRPRGEFRVPYTLAIDTPAGTTIELAEFAVIPAGSDGIVERFQHRIEGVAPAEGARVRLLYALTPDDAELARIAAERPRRP
ncbi:MAG: hypothetical protein EA356_11000 [Geminicoccaceae bacterium]|nr:MAG: hypothetical protein EA356_11000 [Geminicoccaceae bacterium]